MNIDFDLGDTKLIIKECKSYRCTKQQQAYILATAYWETARTMKPVVEAFWLSEQWRRDNLRYYPYHGRGYVQITWMQNYKKAGDKLGVNLVNDPEETLKPENAAPILVRGMMEGWFTGRKLTDYVRKGKVDYRNARRVVNGTDKQEQIARIAEDYEKALGEYREESNPLQDFIDMLMEWFK